MAWHDVKSHMLYYMASRDAKNAYVRGHTMMLKSRILPYWASHDVKIEYIYLGHHMMLQLHTM